MASSERLHIVGEDEFLEITGQAHGFISATLQRPFESVETTLASQEDVSLALGEMIAEVKEIAGEEEGWMKDLLQSGEKMISGRLREFLSRRILGIYQQSYISDRPGRLLLVGENIRNSAEQLGLQEKDFFRWVMVHETMHVAQFQGPLRGWMKERVHTIVRDHDKESLSSIRAAMTWIEGSADAIMDRPGLLQQGDISRMRSVVEERRERVTWSNILLRLLGNKRAQYKDGKRFVDAGVAALGWESLRRVIEDPIWLPSEEEIRAPSLWIQRYEKNV